MHIERYNIAESDIKIKKKIINNKSIINEEKIINGGVCMNKKTSVYQPLDKKKKDILKSLAGNASTRIDLNKVRDEWKYGNN